MDPTLPPPGQPPVPPTADPRPAADPRTFDRVAVAVGVALLATAVVLSASYTRARGNIDWSNYVMGLLSTLGLLAVAAAGWVLVRDRDRSSDLVAWPGAFGAAGVGLMIAVTLDDSEATAYVAGLAVVALSAAGYLLVRRDAFVVSAIGGLFVAYAKLWDDILDFDDAGDNFAVALSAGLLIFTVLVTAAGWLLPSRALSGIVAGVIAVVGNVSLLAGLGIAAAFRTAFSGFELESGRGARPERFDEYDNDVWFILLFALLLIAGWGWCAYVTHHVGFRLLIVAMAVGTVPIAVRVLAVEHPTWWEAVVGVVGGLILVAVGLRALGRLPGQSPGGTSGG